MATFKKGDVVICKKYDCAEMLAFDCYGMRYENYIDDSFFNREAVIEHSRKEFMDEYFKNSLHEEFKDKDEYSIKFLDNGESLSWVKADDLVPKYPHHFTFEKFPGMQELKRKFEASKNAQEKLIKDIEFGIKATDAEDVYSIGMRNGMRWCLSLIDGKEPKYDKCKNRENEQESSLFVEE